MNTVVVAGAGTGKTYTLVQAYLQTLLNPDASGKRRHPQQILAVTFTEKAASEMRTRVASHLIKMARDENESAPGSDRVRELRVLSRGLLAAPICTFHSFCAQLLREHAGAAGLDANFTLLSPNDENDLALELAEATVLDALARGVDNVGHLIARHSLRRLDDSNGLAENLVSLYRDVLEQGVDAKDMQLTVAHLEVALGESDEFGRLVGDVKNALEDFKSAPKLSPATQEKLVKVETSLQRLSTIPTASRDELEVILSATFKELRTSMAGNFGSTEHRKALVLATSRLGSFLCNAFTSPDAYTIRLLLEQFAARFNAYKIQFGVLGFGDLLRMARDLLKSNTVVRKAAKLRFCRVLVDEFQDTSPLQEDIVALLCEEKSLEREVAPHERAMSVLPLEPDVLFVVGDPKQSIYGFRGADVRLFTHTLEAVVKGHQGHAPTGQRESLKLCRRSQGAIVKLVNQVAAVTLPNTLDGVPFDDDDRLEAMLDAKEHAGAIWKVDSDDTLASQIRTLVDAQGVLPKDIAVLCRRVKEASQLVQALGRAGVPARVHGGDGFFERLEVMDILAALKLVVDPGDELATLTVLRSPLVAMSDSDIVALLDGFESWRGGMRFIDIENIVDIAPIDQDARARLKSFVLMIGKIRASLGTLSLGQAIDLLLDEGNYVLAIALEPDADERLANLTKLRAMCAGFVNDAPMRINRLWAALNSPPKESLAEPLDAQTNAVTVMTIHQAKGLEFPVVVIADTKSTPPYEKDDIAFDPEAGLAVSHKGRPISVCAPSDDNKKATPTAIDVVRQRKRLRVEAELARLLYVALTRAKDSVYFVDVEIEGQRTSSQASLRRLFYEGREVDAQGFDALMPVVEVEAVKVIGGMAVVEAAIVPEPPSYEQPKQVRKLMFASQIPPLEKGSKIPQPPFPKGEFKTQTKEMGTLGHALIAAVGSQMDTTTTREQVDFYLSAAARLLGENLQNPEVKRVSQLCAHTLNGPLASLIQQGYWLSFEEPIHFEQNDVVIEGSADLIARGSEDVLVVDFKSSKHTAQSATTLAQLNAYAAAIQTHSELPVYVASCVIGDDEDLQPLEATSWQ